MLCRHCGHDFSLVKPLLARLISLEREVEAIRAKPGRRPAEQAPSYPFSAFVATALCILLTSGYFYLVIDPPPPVDNPNLPVVLATVVPPTVLGLAVGMIWNRRWRSYIPSGISLGALNFVACWLMVISLEGGSFRWLVALGVFAGQALIFIASALVGSSLRRRWNTFSKGRSRGPGGNDAPEKSSWTFSNAIELLIKVSTLAGGITGTALGAVKLFGGAQP